MWLFRLIWSHSQPTKPFLCDATYYLQCWTYVTNSLSGTCELLSCLWSKVYISYLLFLFLAFSIIGAEKPCIVGYVIQLDVGFPGFLVGNFALPDLEMIIYNSIDYYLDVNYMRFGFVWRPLTEDWNLARYIIKSGGSFDRFGSHADEQKILYCLWIQYMWIFYMLWRLCQLLCPFAFPV